MNSRDTKNLSSLVWWTWDLGESNLVNLTIIIQKKNISATMTNKTILTGFRTVTLKQDKDVFGSSFIINLNGIDLFMRGGNYIPPEMMMDKTNSDTYKKIKEYALNAKFNMIRVWGGGQFEKD